MRELVDSVWQRRGISWIWNKKLLSQIARSSEIISLRQLVKLSVDFPDSLPSNDGNAVVVSGFDGSIDLLTPSDSTEWLQSVLKNLIYRFQEYYATDAALIFWLPKGKDRFHIETATDEISWVCGPANPKERIDIGSRLWGGTGDYPQKIVIQDEDDFAGLYHARIT